MKTFLLENLEYQWALIRETPHSQKFEVDIVERRSDLKALVDIHYTRPFIVYATICLIGEKYLYTDDLLHSIFFDLEKIVERNGDYKMIEYSLAFVSSMREGNFPIN